MAKKEERDQLVKAICESVRAYAPHQRVDAYFKMRRRLRRTRITILREILEEDIVNARGGEFIREAIHQ